MSIELKKHFAVDSPGKVSGLLYVESTLQWRVLRKENLYENKNKKFIDLALYNFSIIKYNAGVFAIQECHRRIRNT